jgi:tetratricopeptide (TPR) repeat protein
MQERRMIKTLQETLAARDSGDPAQFLAAANNCVRKVPGQDISHILRGQALMVNGRHDEAINAIDHAFGLGSWDQGEATSARAEIYMHAENYRAALQELTKLANHPEHRSEALCGRAMCMLEFDDREQALKDANEAVALDPSSVTYHLRSTVHAVRGDYAGALADLDRGIQIAGSADSDDLEFRANILDELGRSDEAKGDRDRAATMREPDPSPSDEGTPEAATPREESTRTSAGSMQTSSSGPSSTATPKDTKNPKMTTAAGGALFLLGVLLGVPFLAVIGFLLLVGGGLWWMFYASQ